MQEGSAKARVEVLGTSVVSVLTARAGTQGPRPPANLRYPDTFQMLYKQSEERRHLLERGTAASEHPANTFAHCCNKHLQDEKVRLTRTGNHFPSQPRQLLQRLQEEICLRAPALRTRHGDAGGLSGAEPEPRRAPRASALQVTVSNSQQRSGTQGTSWEGR